MKTEKFKNKSQFKIILYTGGKNYVETIFPQRLLNLIITH